MKSLNTLKNVSVAALVVCIAACAQHSAEPQKTEVLPADGGDLGKTYAEYAKAVDAGDKAQILKFSNPELADKGVAFFQFTGKLGTGQPIGGRQQGDRATLFVRAPTSTAQENFVSLRNATHAGSGWQFDSPLQQATAGYGNKPFYDCSKTAEFPCGILTAPDSIVSGTILLHKYDTFVHKTAPIFVMFDGFAVRRFDEDGKTPKGTRLFLSSMGIIPEVITNDHNKDMSSVRLTLTAPLLDLDVAPDGKSAHARLTDQGTLKKIDIKDGLTIEVNDGKRIRGRLNTDIKDLAAFNLYFDMATASVCHAQSSDCSHD